MDSFSLVPGFTVYSTSSDGLGRTADPPMLVDEEYYSWVQGGFA